MNMFTPPHLLASHLLRNHVHRIGRGVREATDALVDFLNQIRQSFGPLNRPFLLSLRRVGFAHAARVARHLRHTGERLGRSPAAGGISVEGMRPFVHPLSRQEETPAPSSPKHPPPSSKHHPPDNPPRYEMKSFKENKHRGPKRPPMICPPLNPPGPPPEPPAPPARAPPPPPLKPSHLRTGVSVCVATCARICVQAASRGKGGEREERASREKEKREYVYACEGESAPKCGKLSEAKVSVVGASRIQQCESISAPAWAFNLYRSICQSGEESPLQRPVCQSVCKSLYLSRYVPIFLFLSLFRSLEKTKRPQPRLPRLLDRGSGLRQKKLTALWGEGLSLRQGELTVLSRGIRQEELTVMMCEEPSLRWGGLTRGIWQKGNAV